MLNTIIKTFDDMIFNGVRNISVAILAIMTVIAGIDFLLAYIYEFSEDFSGAMRTFFRKIISYAFFFGIAAKYKDITMMFRSIFIKIGYLFFESAPSGDTKLPDLDNIYETLKVSVWKILKAAESLKGIKNVGNKFAMFLIFLIAMLLIFIIVKEILLKFIEFQIITGIAIIFLPFNMFEQTKSIGAKLWNGILMSGTRLMLVLALTGMGITVLRDNPISVSNNSVDFTNILAWVFVLGIISMMISSSAGLAGLLVSGSGEGLSGSQVGSMIAKGVTAAGLSVVGGFAVAGAAVGGAGGLAKGIYSAYKQGGGGTSSIAKGALSTISSTVKGSVSGLKYGAGNSMVKSLKNTATTISNFANIVSGNQSLGTLRAGVDRRKGASLGEALQGSLGNGAAEHWQNIKDNISDNLKASSDTVKSTFYSGVKEGVDEFVNQAGANGIISGINTAGTKMFNKFFDFKSVGEEMKVNMENRKGETARKRDMNERPYAYDEDFINSIKNS